MGRLIIVQPGRAVVELPIALPAVPVLADGRPGVQTAIAADRIEARRAVRLVTASTVVHASTPFPQHAGAVYGITLEAANEGQYVRLRTEGVERFPGAGFVPDLPVFAGIDGALTQNTTNFAVDVQVGTAITADTMLVRIELPIYRGVLP